MQINNTQERYGAMVIFLHWLMAIIIIGLLILGLYMADLPDTPRKFKFFRWHKEFGALILMLVTFRLLWRVLDKVPSLPIKMPSWQKFGAHGVHWLLYAAMIAMPMTGWLMSSSAGFPVSFFGLFILPDLIQPNETLRPLLAGAHEWIAYGLIALLVGHSTAALYHHFVEKNDIFLRILPRVK